MNVTIRQLKPDDWAILQNVRLTALQSDPNSFGSWYANEAHKTEADWRKQLEFADGAIFGLFDGDTAIGMTGVAVDRNDPSKTRGVLWGSWIHPDYRGKGLSKLLYEARIGWAKAHPTMEILMVSHRAHNTASKFANQKHGFVYKKTESKTWHGDVVEDDLNYELRLDKKSG